MAREMAGKHLGARLPVRPEIAEQVKRDPHWFSLGERWTEDERRTAAERGAADVLPVAAPPEVAAAAERQYQYEEFTFSRPDPAVPPPPDDMPYGAEDPQGVEDEYEGF
jgi:hypothetical protein